MGISVFKRDARRGRKVLAALALGLACLLVSGPGWAAGPTKRILILFPLESNSPGFVKFDSALRSTLTGSQAHEFDFYVECMDLLRFPGEDYLADLVRIYREKYSERHIDLIIALLRPSLDFLSRHGDRLFPGTPVLFMNLDSRLIDEQAAPRCTAVVTGKIGMESTLDLALRLHPGTREVFVVSGVSQVDRDLVALAQNVFRGYVDRVGFHYLAGLSMEELLWRVSASPPHSLIYYLSFLQDTDGKAFLPDQAVAMISAKANVPLYGISESYIGAGAVGGQVFSFGQLGAKAARSALRILSGEKRGAIEPLEEKADEVVFDWRQLKRWGIREAELPAGSIVRQREFSLWEAYRFQILGIASVLILQTLLIGALIFNLKRRRQANRALSESEEQLQQAAEEWKTTFDSIPDRILVLDQSLGILRANQAALCFHGLDLDQVVGNPFHTLIGSAAADPAGGPLEKTLETKRHEEREIYDQGRDAWYLESVDPILDDRGEITRIIHTVRDITQRRRAEAEAHRRMTELAHVTRVATIGELAASLAHEINQPLTAILTNAQAGLRFLSAGAPDLDEIRQILVDIARDDNRVSEVIRSMRALLKKQSDSHEAFELNKAVAECVALVNDSSPLEGLSIRTDLTTKQPVVWADRVQLQQVLFNLMVNAVGAMSAVPRAGRRLVITTALEDRQSVKVAVTDSGPGIDERQLEHLFEPFYTTKAEGLGMGLAISRTIVEAHGGKMGALNQAEGGATFFFTLPIVREELP